MARNDVVLLDSLVAKSRSRFGAEVDESELFELFTFDELLKDYDPSYDELESGWTDGGNDGGIDGLFVFVDGRIATPDSPKYAAKRCPTIDLHIFSVKHSAKFEQQPIDSLISSLGELLDLGLSAASLKYPFNEAVLQQRKLFSSIYLALADRHPAFQLLVHYCSRGDEQQVAPNLKSRAETLRKLLDDLFSSAQISVGFVGASSLLASARKQRDFSLRLPFIETYISREGKNYVLLCTLSDYFHFVTDEQGDLRRYLFESNVRDYLGDVLINQNIKETLSRRDPPDQSDFWWLNNGVTILGTSASVAGKDLCIENVQIVNGLQTTETLFHHFSTNHVDHDSRAILVKVILAADEETRARIVKATNYQNTVDLASLRGLDKIQRDIEAFLADHGWFYDRKKNFYKNQGKPAERIVSVPYLAGAVRAIVLGDPVRSQKHRSRSLREDSVYHAVFNPKWDLRVFLAAAEITRTIEMALHTRRSTWDSPPIALVHYIGFVYTCMRLNKFPYQPDEVAALVGVPPDKATICSIRKDLMHESEKVKDPGRKYQGVKMNSAFIERFVRTRFAPK